jgi:hypothetical protein
MYSRALAIASIVCLMFSTSISSANEAFMNKCTAGAVSTGIAPADPMHFGLRLRGGVSRGELQQRAAEMRKKEGTAVKAAAVGLQGNPPEGGNDSSRGDNAVEKLKMEIGGENIELELSKIDSPVVLDGNEEMEVPSTLFLAASTGDAAAIESLLEHGASHAKVNDDGDTPLHIAAYHGHATAVAALCAGALKPSSTPLPCREPRPAGRL